VERLETRQTLEVYQTLVSNGCVIEHKFLEVVEHFDGRQSFIGDVIALDHGPLTVTAIDRRGNDFGSSSRVLRPTFVSRLRQGALKGVHDDALID
jgi:hypothetical protein